MEPVETKINHLMHGIDTDTKINHLMPGIDENLLIKTEFLKIIRTFKVQKIKEEDKSKFLNQNLDW